MKRWILLMIMAAVVSFGVARWTTLRAQRSTSVSIHDAGWLKSELKLTDVQSREIESLNAAFRKQLDAACAEHCGARMKLGEELAKLSVDVSKARGFVDQMNSAQAGSEQATLEHILKVRALLDASQAKRYSEMVQQQVCNMPMGAY